MVEFMNLNFTLLWNYIRALKNAKLLNESKKSLRMQNLSAHAGNNHKERAT